MRAILSDAPFDAAAEIGAFSARAEGSGAVVSFVGKVRADRPGGRVIALELDHYPGATERSMLKVLFDAAARWMIDDALILHRVGRIGATESIVLVCAAAAHRRDAFEAVDFLMDYLKTEALLWKKEIREDGEFWIEPRAEDHRDAARWRAADQAGITPRAGAGV